LRQLMVKPGNGQSSRQIAACRNGSCYLCIAETAMLACVLLQPPALYVSI
jgi:hypothetical protein